MFNDVTHLIVQVTIVMGDLDDNPQENLHEGPVKGQCLLWCVWCVWWSSVI